MARGKLIRFPVERRDNYTGFEKDRWFREAVAEMVDSIDEFLTNFDIFTGRRKDPPDKE